MAKYVVGELRTALGSVLAAVLIPEFVDHSSIKSLFVEGSIDSAGFCEVDEAGKPWCYGDSTSLKLTAKVERDEKLVRRLLKK